MKVTHALPSGDGGTNKHLVKNLGHLPRASVRVFCWLLLMSLLIFAAGCDSMGTANGGDVPVAEAAETEEVPTVADPGAAEVLPAIEPVTLEEGELLRVVATTSLVADIAQRVGGDVVEVTTLMPLGVDPHSYTPTPEDLRTLNDPHLILINGLGLEEALMSTLEELDTPVPVVSVNAGLAPLTYSAGTEAGGATTGEQAEASAAAQDLDAHTWLSVNNVLIWVDNVAATFAMLDTVNVDTYFSNAGTLQGELTALDTELREQIDTLPSERRKLVTDHQEFNYFAQDYGFEVIGSAIPGVSTGVESTAQELAALQGRIAGAGINAIFVGENVTASVIEQLAADLSLEVVRLYTSSLSEPDGPAPDYASLMRYNVNAIVSALAE